MDFPAQKEDVCYAWNNGAMATEDINLDYGIGRCIRENHLGGIEGSLDPKHHDRWWRLQIVPDRTARGEAKEAANPGHSRLE
jgi:hypothetical protein